MLGLVLMLAVGGQTLSAPDDPWPAAELASYGHARELSEYASAKCESYWREVRAGASPKVAWQRAVKGMTPEGESSLLMVCYAYEQGRREAGL